MANSKNLNKRHVGKIANTDQRCIVAWMQIPNREDHALCIPTDSLPPRLEQAVMQVLESDEGQAEEILANILSRRKMPDSPNNTLFEALHVGRHMVAVPVNQVIMFPRPNMPFPLVDILRSMGRVNQKVTAEETMATNKFNTHLHNKAAMSVEQRLGVARNLIMEATDLENVANQKRHQAYDLAPELMPKKVEMIHISDPVPSVSPSSSGLETFTPVHTTVHSGGMTSGHVNEGYSPLSMMDDYSSSAMDMPAAEPFDYFKITQPDAE